jgi:glycosyltransferase involved in cell wall biosynthesis
MTAPVCLAFVYPQLKRLTGAQRLILQLATELTRQGHDVTLVTHQLAAACRDLLAPAVAVVETGQRIDLTNRHLIDSALEYGASARLVRHLPAVLDATVFFGPPSLPALAWAGRQGRRALVSFCYEPPRFAYADRELLAARFGRAAPLVRAVMRGYRPFDRWLLGQADLVAANGRFGATEIARVYGRPAVVIDHGVALAPVTPAAMMALDATYRLGDAPVILTVNHLHPRKRIDLFLATVAQVRRSVPAAIGVVAGDGRERQRLIGLADGLGIGDAVRFTGFIADRDLAALYRRATVYLHTGQRETFGLSVLEAAASGCPVVAVDEGGPRDILDDGRLGRLTPANADALSAAVGALLRDPLQATALGRTAAAAVLARFQWAHGAATMAAVAVGLRQGLTEAEIVARSAGVT